MICEKIKRYIWKGDFSMSKQKKWILVLSTVLAVLIATMVLLYLRMEQGETFKEYEIFIENATYCPKTCTGTMEVTVEYQNKGYKKMFATSNDVLGDGDKKIVDDEYLLRIMRGENTLLSLAQEMESTEKYQKLKVYFINESGNFEEDNVSLNICEGTEENIAAQIETKMKLDDEAIIFGDKLNVTVSSTGVILNGFSQISQSYYGDVSIKIKWKDKTKILMMNKYMSEEKNVNNSEIIVPKLISNEGENREKRIYVIELEDWKNIEIVHLADSVLERTGGDGELREQDSEEQKERYLKVLSKEVLEQYDSGVTYEQLIEDPEAYQMKTTVIISGRVVDVADNLNDTLAITMKTEDGPLIGYTANKIGLQEINIGDEYVICGHFQGMDPAGVPLFQVLVIKSLEDL